MVVLVTGDNLEVGVTELSVNVMGCRAKPTEGSGDWARLCTYARPHLGRSLKLVLDGDEFEVWSSIAVRRSAIGTPRHVARSKSWTCIARSN